MENVLLMFSPCSRQFVSAMVVVFAIGSHAIAIELEISPERDSNRIQAARSITFDLLMRAKKRRLQSKAAVTFPILSAGKPAHAHREMLVKYEPFNDEVLLTTSRALEGTSDDIRQVHEHKIESTGRILTAQAYFDAVGVQIKGHQERQLGLLLSDRSRVKGKTPVRSADQLYEFDGIGFPFGYLAGTELNSYLSEQAETSMRQEGETFFLTSVSELGVIDLEISAMHDGYPSRFEVIKKSTDRFGDDIAGNYTLNQIAETGRALNASDRRKFEIQEIHWKVEVDRFERTRANESFPAQYRYSRTIKYSGGNLSELSSVVSVSELPESTAEDARFTFDIPVGEPVTLRGAPQLPFIWDGTDAVPAPPKLSEMQTRIAEGRSTSRTWLLVINGALLVIAPMVYFKFRDKSGER